MTIDVPSTGLATGIAVLLWYLLRLTLFTSIARLEKGAADQGRRIGELESWQEAHDKVEDFKHRRKLTAPRGVPVPDEDDSQP